jgi:hypothetical protein
MKTKVLAALALVAVATYCFGLLGLVEPSVLGFAPGEAVAATPKTRITENISPQQFRDLYLERRGTATWDFPALGGGGVNCSDSATLAVPGCAFGDVCLASTDLGMDGGSAALYLNATFSCRAVNNGTVFRACAWAADAGTPGTIDLPDAGLFARCLK